MKGIPFSATMATVATMIVIPDNHRRTAAVSMVTVNPGPQITVAIVATVAVGVQRATAFCAGCRGAAPCAGKGRQPFGTR